MTDLNPGFAVDIYYIVNRIISVYMIFQLIGIGLLFKLRSVVNTSLHLTLTLSGRRGSALRSMIPFELIGNNKVPPFSR